MGTFIWILILAVLIVAIFYFIKVSKKINQADQKVSENVIELTDSNFQGAIKKGVTLVDFWAPWCMPCRVQNPVINQLADELKGKAKICKMNVDEQKKTAVKMNVRNIPNIIIFKNGEPVKQLVGVKPKHIILNAIKTAMK